jgi:hypothetical protein
MVEDVCAIPRAFAEKARLSASAAPVKAGQRPFVRIEEPVETVQFFLSVKKPHSCTMFGKYYVKEA